MIERYYELAGAIIRKAIEDRDRIKSGDYVPSTSLGGIDAFFNSISFEIMAGPYADLIRSEVFADE